MTEWINDVLGENAATEAPEVVDYIKAKGYQTPLDFAKAAHETHKMNTKKTDDIKSALSKDPEFISGIQTEFEKKVIPSDTWGEDEWKAYGDKVRPKDKDAYLKSSKVEIPDELKSFIPAERVNAVVEKAYERGYPAKIVKDFVSDYIADQAVQIKALQDESARLKSDDQAALDKEWGPDKTKFEELAKRGMGFAAKAAGMEEKPFTELLEGYGMDTHPAFKKLFKFVGELSNDPKFVAGNPPKLGETKEKTTGQLLVEAAANPIQN